MDALDDKTAYQVDEAVNLSFPASTATEAYMADRGYIKLSRFITATEAAQ